MVMTNDDDDGGGDGDGGGSSTWQVDPRQLRSKRQNRRSNTQ